MTTKLLSTDKPDNSRQSRTREEEEEIVAEIKRLYRIREALREQLKEKKTEYDILKKAEDHADEKLTNFIKAVDEGLPLFDQEASDADE